MLDWENRLEQSNLPTSSQISRVQLRDVLLMGSAAEDELSQLFWAQLLASYCLGENIDQIRRFGKILSKLPPSAVKIFDGACRMTISGEQSAPCEIYCSSKDVCDFANLPNVPLAEQHLKHLCELRLLSSLSRPKFEKIEWFSMTVATLGLEFYSCCCPSGEVPKSDQ